MEKDNLPLVVCHKEETVCLIERHHFLVEGGFKVHCAGETRDVTIPQFVHHDEQDEVCFPGVLEGHGCVFIL